jgi:hypothetical protein
MVCEKTNYSVLPLFLITAYVTEHVCVPLIYILLL